MLAGRSLEDSGDAVSTVVTLLVVAVVLTRRLDLLVIAVALTVVLLLGGLGVACVVGGWWQWPAPPPGGSPFGKGSSGGLPALLSFLVMTAATVIVALPTVGLAIWSLFTPWVAYLSLVVGVGTGLLTLRLGIVHGGRLLDRRWPEVMRAVSEKAA